MLNMIKEEAPQKLRSRARNMHEKVSCKRIYSVRQGPRQPGPAVSEAVWPNG